jgi:hypothetical protein
MGVNYLDLVPLLVEAVQEIEADISRLSTQRQHQSHNRQQNVKREHEQMQKQKQKQKQEQNKYGNTQSQRVTAEIADSRCVALCCVVHVYVLIPFLISSSFLLFFFPLIFPCRRAVTGFPSHSALFRQQKVEFSQIVSFLPLFLLLYKPITCETFAVSFKTCPFNLRSNFFFSSFCSLYITLHFTMYNLRAVDSR